jgi:protein-(glutamine-N5) methyltransferase, release factor-specific
VDKIFSMTINQVKNLFSEELQSLYTSVECEELFFIFCEKILNLNKIDIRSQLENSISAENQNEFLKIISILKEGKPYQQILGETYFYGNQFFVDENVLIPRPETEELIELIESRLSHLKKEKLKILDVGTGSGCISISLAKIFPNAEVSSIDISEKALNIAKKNADFHKVKINFIQKDYLNEKLDEIYDIIVSNPPYIDVFEREEIPHSVKGFEPNIALFAPENRVLAFYEKIAKDSENHLKKGGSVFLEINQKLGKETLQLFQDVLTKSELIKDLSENDRFVIGEK